MNMKGWEMRAEWLLRSSVESEESDQGCTRWEVFQWQNGVVEVKSVHEARSRRSRVPGCWRSWTLAMLETAVGESVDPEAGKGIY